MLSTASLELGWSHFRAEHIALGSWIISTFFLSVEERLDAFCRVENP